VFVRLRRPRHCSTSSRNTPTYTLHSGADAQGRPKEIALVPKVRYLLRVSDSLDPSCRRNRAAFLSLDLIRRCISRRYQYCLPAPKLEKSAPDSRRLLGSSDVNRERSRCRKLALFGEMAERKPIPRSLPPVFLGWERIRERFVKIA